MKPAGYAVLGVVTLVALPALLRQVFPALAYALPVAFNLGLAVIFAQTLRAGREPMIARFALAERGTLEPELAAYARGLTWVWVAFFVASAALAAALARWGSARAWITFTSFGNYAAVAALFVGEYWWRRHRFRRYTHASPRVMWSHVSAVLRGARGRRR
ncbi:MAG: hypothetical protein ABI881_03025 [Betaproteobacteria bacterium]